MLTTAQTDRAAGVLVGQACGDALGVPYEFAPPPPVDREPVMAGGGLGGYAPGEWSDDTQMAVCIAETLAGGADPTSESTLDEIAERFEDWFAHGATDVGSQTRSVLTNARRLSGPPAQRLRDAAAALHARTGHTAGNGALMRTAPVALACLDGDALPGAARAIAELTHADPLAGDSCVIWCSAVRRAVVDARFDGIEESIALVPAPRRDRWAAWVQAAETSPPSRFRPNGFTVTALQAAWSAIRHTEIPDDDPGRGRFPCRHLQDAIVTAVRVGDDADTVAAIAGALAGGHWGLSAVPARWRRPLHGWPELRGRDLARLAILITRHGRDDAQGWPSGARMDYAESERTPVAHPDDPGTLLGTASWPSSVVVDAVVSLCRLGRDEVPAPGVAAPDHVEAWLVDSVDPADNPNLPFVIDDAARAAATMRREGKRVLVHCVRAETRTPIVGARVAVLQGAPDADAALSDVRAALGSPPSSRALRDAYRALGEWGSGDLRLPTSGLSR